MKRRNFRQVYFFFLPFFLIRLFFVSFAIPVEARSGLVGILISQEIRPFIQMVEGLEANLDMPACRIFLDKDEKPYSQDSRFKKLDPENFSVIVAVGPRALSYLITHNWSAPAFYGMVLNPERFVGKQSSFCGISLNISVWEQILLIHQTFPDVKRLGVLFDPTENQAWFNAAQAFLTLKKINLIPLSISRRSDISNLFKGKRPEVDAILFIPDQTVISKSIIQYVIKEAIFKGIPTIGYNRFFHESGAALSFVIDYRFVGVQVARQVRALMDDTPCLSSGPRYDVLLNRNVIQKLGVKLGSRLPETVQED